MSRRGPERIRLSARGRVKVVGETYYQPALRRAAGGRAVPPRDFGAAIGVRAELVPEPDNPYDANAVAVQVDGDKVGHLSRELAPDYQPALLELERTGRRGWCPGWIMGGGERNYGIHLWLSDPAALLLENTPLVDEVLPPETMVAVVDEEAYQDALVPMLADRVSRLLYAECLPPETSDGPGSPTGRLGIRIERQLVGCLTQRMSGRYASLVRDQVSQHGQATCESMVHRTHRGVDVEVFLPKVGVDRDSEAQQPAVRSRAPEVEESRRPKPRPSEPWPPEAQVPPAPALRADLEPATKPGRATKKLIAEAQQLAAELRSSRRP